MKKAPPQYKTIRRGLVRVGDLVRNSSFDDNDWEEADGLIGSRVWDGIVQGRICPWVACRKLKAKVVEVAAEKFEFTVTRNGRVYSFVIDNSTPFTYAK